MWLYPPKLSIETFTFAVLSGSTLGGEILISSVRSSSARASSNLRVINKRRKKIANDPFIKIN